MKGNSHRTSHRRSRSSAPHHTVVGDALRETGHKIDELGEMAGSKTDQWVNRGTEMASNVREEVGEYGDKVVGYIQDHPVQSMLIAGAIGIVVGKLFLRIK